MNDKIRRHWLAYFNRILLEMNCITEAEYQQIRRKIQHTTQ